MSCDLFGWLFRPEHKLEHLRVSLEEAVGLLSEEQVEKLMSCNLIQRDISQYFGFEE
jgi:hypothetical protein